MDAKVTAIKRTDFTKDTYRLTFDTESGPLTISGEYGGVGGLITTLFNIEEQHSRVFGDDGTSYLAEDFHVTDGIEGFPTAILVKIISGDQFRRTIFTNPALAKGLADAINEALEHNASIAATAAIKRAH